MNEPERLLTIFCRGVRHPQVSGFEVLELLDVRSTLAGEERELTEAQRKELEEADSAFLKNVEQFYENVIQVANLEEMRKRATVPPSHWWWYLEKLRPAEQAAL
jgi:hypothetical protein